MYPSLPPELAPIVLCQAPDAPTLRNLIISAPSFYHGYRATPKIILEAVLSNEYGSRLLPEALTTQLSARLPKEDFDSARDVLLTKLQNKPQVPVDWTLADSLALSKIHDNVNFFALEFAAHWNEHVDETIPLDNEPATRTEMERIRRALFRFELYCNSFPKSLDRPGPDERKELFLDRFSPWENEQLVTMYEYLLERMSIAFNDIAEHDVLWGKHNIQFTLNDYPPDNNFKEHCMSLGLSWLRRLAMANTYDERYRLLAPETGNQDHSFIYKTFYDPYDVQAMLIELSDLTEQSVLSHVNPPFIEDSDRGPFTAWWWAYKDKDFTAAEMYAVRELAPLRKAGYVMFDYDRVQRRDLLSRFFDQWKDSQARKEKRIRARERLEESQRKRSKIYDRGGRGYWSEKGDSKLIWGEAPFLGDGIEYTLGHQEYRDYWKDGVLLDRLRMDGYFAIMDS